LDPKTVATTAMLIKIDHEIQHHQSRLPLKRMVVSNADAAKIYQERGYRTNKRFSSTAPRKPSIFMNATAILDYMYSHMVPSTGYLTKYKLRLYTPGFLLQYPRSECNGEDPGIRRCPDLRPHLREAHDWAKVVGVDTVAHINEEIEKAGAIEFINVCEDRHFRQCSSNWAN
jgi:uridine kinase